MTNRNTKNITLIAILTAITVILGRVFLIPTPTGLLTLLDAGIYFTAFYLGKKQAGLVGALSGFLIDLLAGAPQWMLFSLIAHGLQGYFAGYGKPFRALGLALASLTMILVYFVASLVLGYGLPSSLAAIPGNIGQNFLGMATGYVLFVAYKSVKK